MIKRPSKEWKSPRKSGHLVKNSNSLKLGDICEWELRCIFGRNKVYEGVLGNLVAFACKLSFEKGFDGYVVFEPKTRSINHYSKMLKAKSISGTRMYIDKTAANFLIDTYYKH